jgi:hypothetical protein
VFVVVYVDCLGSLLDEFEVEVEECIYAAGVAVRVA